jgi:hypothetical protein
LQPIERYERLVDGNHPPSISPTRRQLIGAGLPFCSLQATTQHLQPMHAHVHVEAVLLAGAGRTIGHAFAFAASPRRRNKLLPAGLDPLEQRQLGRCSVGAAADAASA